MDDVPEGFHGFLPEKDEEDADRILDRYTVNGEKIRLVGNYSESMQKWLIRKQVVREGEWRTSGWGVRLSRNGPNNHPDRVDYIHNRFVKSQNGMFTDLPMHYRLILAPLYGVIFAWMCVRGQDVNVQTLHDPDWTPE